MLGPVVTLKWTSPGNDYDLGQATDYSIKCYTDPKILLEGSGFSQKAISVPLEQLPVPMPSGTVQRTTVKVPWADEVSIGTVLSNYDLNNPNFFVKVFYYGIAASDKSGNTGPVSNLVPVYVESPPQTTTSSDPAVLLFKV